MANAEAAGRCVIVGFRSGFSTNKSLADRAIAQVPDDRLHVSLHPETNSIAIIMRHLAGNLRSRWTDFLTSDGEKPWRNRDEEFRETSLSRAELAAEWESGWACVFGTLSGLGPTDLERHVLIRGETLTVPQALARSLAHTGYHTGQIVMIARILAGEGWQTLTIPRGGSSAYNQRVWGANR